MLKIINGLGEGIMLLEFIRNISASIKALKFCNFVLLMSLSQSVLALPTSGAITTLSGEVEFSQFDASRDVIYASIPSQNQIAVISTTDLQVVDVISFTGEPHGLDLSSDNSTLYVALSETGTVGIVDLLGGNFTTTEIDVSQDLAANSSLITDIYDVLINGDDIFVTASPGSSGISNMVVVDQSNANAISKIGLVDNDYYLIARDKPVLSLNLDKTELVVNASLGITRIDIIDPIYPVIIRTQNRLLESGVITQLQNEDLILEHGFQVSYPFLELVGTYDGPNFFERQFTPNLTNNYLIASDSSGLVSFRIGDSDGFIDTIENVCGVANSISEIIIEENDSGVFLFLGNGNVCYLTQDQDNDNRFDLLDNCPDIANPDQVNNDADRFGDMCDDDDDNDGLLDAVDPYPTSVDGDMDGVPDSQDAYPTFFGAAFDSDGDGDPDNFFDDCDASCQLNSGLSEDLDDDNDLIPDDQDPQPLIADQSSKQFLLNSISTINLPTEPSDIVVDQDRSLAYVSLPQSNQVYWISLKDLQVVFSREVSGEPGVMLLSKDGEDLIIGLSDSGKIEFLDLTSPTLESQVVDISMELNSFDNRRNFIIGDILEVNDNRIFVIGSEFASTLIELDQVTRNLVSVSDFTHSVLSLLAADEDSMTLYIEDGPNIYKYNYSEAGSPVFVESLLVEGNSVRRGLSLSSDGDYLFLGEGRVVKTDLSLNSLESFSKDIEYDQVESYSVISDTLNTSQRSLLDTKANVLFNFDETSFVKVGQLNNPCNGLDENYESLFQADRNDTGWLLTKKVNDSYQLCYQPKLNSFADNFPTPPINFATSDYFLSNDTTPIYYQGNSDLIFNRAFSSGTTSINGTPTKQLDDSRNLQEFYTISSSGVALVREISAGSGISDYSPALPMLPQKMKQGYTDFSQGLIITRDVFNQNVTFAYEAKIIVDDYQSVALKDNVQIDAYRVKRQVEVGFGSNSEIAVDYFWFAENFGLVQTQDEALRITAQALSTRDTDNDGIPDSIDTDDDGDNVPDFLDAFPLDASESADFDNDGVGDNKDKDDDNDRIPDDYELANGLDPNNAADATQDSDGDGRDNITEYNQGTDPQVVDDANPATISPIIELLLSE